MAYSYTSRNGSRVQVDVAAAFDRLAAEFKRVFGLDLIVSDGTRTRAEQAELYRLYKAGKGNLAAAPGYSNHEESGPRGPRALDVRDSGNDAGVTRYGSARANWLRANASRFGFDPAGYGFSQTEPWHIEYTGSLNGTGGGGGEDWHTAASVLDIQTLGKKLGFPGAVDGIDGPETRGWVTAFQRDHGLDQDGRVGPATWAKMNEIANRPQGDEATRQRQAWLNHARGEKLDVDGIQGQATTEAIKRYQSFLGVDADGQWGPATQAAHAIYYDKVTRNGNLDVDGQWGAATTKRLQEVLGVPADGEIGPQTIKALQTALGVDADGEIGPNTARALQAAVGAPQDGEIGPDTIRHLQTFLNEGKSFGKPAPVPAPQPEGEVGRNATSRPTKEIQEFLISKGYDLGSFGADGDYGVSTTKAVKAWQKASEIDADGIWGSGSDGLAFPPAGSIKGVDYSFARPSIDKLKANGIKLAGRYLWRDKYDDGVRTNKGINKAELAALKAAGIDVFFIYEEDGKELLGGREAGKAVAVKAEAFLNGLGLKDYPIYFNVDYDAPAGDMPKILEALEGIAEVIGLERVGLYAGYGPLKAAFDAKKITWGFQTYGWSGGKWDDRAHLQQWFNGQWGGSIDFTRAIKAEYGQNPVKKTSDPVTPPIVDDENVSVPKKLLEPLYGFLKGIFGK